MGTEDAGTTLVREADVPFGEVGELAALVGRGQERGWLTFEEVASCLEEVELTKEQVAGLHAHLLDQGVDVVSEDGRPALVESDGAQPVEADGSRA